MEQTIHFINQFIRILLEKRCQIFFWSRQISLLSISTISTYH